VVNWEAITLIGGASILLCLALSFVVIALRRHRSPQDGPLDASVPTAGLVLHSFQVLAMISGIFLYKLVPETSFGWARLLFLAVYYYGLIVIFALVSDFLEKRGIKVVATKREGPPPNKSLERTRER
jgi:hypothetical protein